MNVSSFSPVALATALVVIAGCNSEFCDIVACASASGGGGGGTGGGIDASCLPASLDGAKLRDDCGIFVEPGAAAAEADGSQAAPFGTLDAALAALPTSTRPKVVFICGSATLTGSFTMPGGASIVGGVSCQWSAEPQSKPTLAGATANQPTLVVAGTGMDATRIEGVTINGIAGTGNGGSSIALFVHRADVTIANAVVVAADGSAGANGVQGMDAMTMAPAGWLPSSCDPTAQPAAMHTCDGEPTHGGKGGDAGQDGEPGLPPGLGGAQGEADGSCNMSATGQPGLDGGAPEPTPPMGMTDAGTLVMYGFQVMTASSGQPGKPGGGGGGGAGAMCSAAGGGAGGCGGLPGGGGQVGGASIAVAVLEGALSFGDAVELRSGLGGRGGNGGGGGTGESGGTSGLGPFGCGAGAGGDGGPGGNGAGANGGLSALVVSQQATINGMIPGAVGTGGDAGAAVSPAPAGEVGTRCRRFDSSSQECVVGL